MEEADPFAELRARIDDPLYALLAERAAAIPAAGDLLAILRGVVAAGGKRLRPLFCYWGFRAAGGPDGGEIVRAAGALELLHTFAIVHDDIMDRSDIRRGVPSVHAAHGTDVALLAGDLALVLADHAFMGSGFGAVELSVSFHAYSRMRQEVIAGQYLDLVATPAITEEEAAAIARLKSGRYTVVEPLAIGAALAGADDSLTEVLADFGGPVGEAFQLRDDLLGVFGDPGVTGKPADSDIREGKRNLLYAAAAAGLPEAERAWFTERWGAPGLTDAEVARLRGLVESSGARAAMEQRIGDLERTAGDALARADVPPDARDALRVLARSSVARET